MFDVHTIESENLNVMRHQVYFAKDKEDAIKFIKKNGGVLFKEKGTDNYSVFITDFKQSAIFTMIEEQ